MRVFTFSFQFEFAGFRKKNTQHITVSMEMVRMEKYFLHYYKNFRQFCFNPEPKVKGMFLFTFNKLLYYITMSMERARGSNKLL